MVQEGWVARRRQQRGRWVWAVCLIDAQCEQAWVWGCSACCCWDGLFVLLAPRSPSFPPCCRLPACRTTSPQTGTGLISWTKHPALRDKFMEVRGVPEAAWLASFQQWARASIVPILPTRCVRCLLVGPAGCQGHEGYPRQVAAFARQHACSARGAGAAAAGKGVRFVGVFDWFATAHQTCMLMPTACFCACSRCSTPPRCRMSASHTPGSVLETVLRSCQVPRSGRGGSLAGV